LPCFLATGTVSNIGAVIPQVVVTAGEVLDAGDLSSAPDPRWLSEQTDHPTRWEISLDSMVGAVTVFEINADGSTHMQGAQSTVGFLRKQNKMRNCLTRMEDEK
jgi:hypothetical protein